MRVCTKKIYTVSTKKYRLLTSGTVCIKQCTVSSFHLTAMANFSSSGLYQTRYSPLVRTAFEFEFAFSFNVVHGFIIIISARLQTKETLILPNTVLSFEPDILISTATFSFNVVHGIIMHSLQSFRPPLERFLNESLLDYKYIFLVCFSQVE